jgi:hypothetical protein
VPEHASLASNSARAAPAELCLCHQTRESKVGIHLAGLAAPDWFVILHLASYDDVTSSLFCLHRRPLRPKPASSTPLRLGIILFASLSASHQEATA